jgi:hypothetical protein
MDSIGRSTGGSANRRLLIMLVALGVAGCAAAYFWVTRPGPKEIAPSEVFERLTAHGFVPEFVCTEPAEFVKTVKDRFGTGLAMAETPPEIEILGWAYANDYEGRVIGGKTLILMARVNTRPTLVLIDRLSEDRTLSDPAALMGNWTGGDISNPMSVQTSPRADGKLSLFRRASGKLVLYELTPFERPELLGRLEER